MTEVMAMGAEALNAHIAWMVRDGDQIAQPTPPEEVERKDDPVALVMIEATIPGKSVRLNVTLDENLVERIDAVASNRSAFLAAAARSELAKRSA